MILIFNVINFNKSEINYYKKELLKRIETKEKNFCYLISVRYCSISSLEATVNFLSSDLI